MIYRMTVEIYDPTNERKDRTLNLLCEFSCNSGDYGNGHYVSIEDDDLQFDKYFDIRYDRTFNPEKKMQWLTDCAYSYWSGEKGSYKVKSLSISHA